jgi:hypothetical protein
VVTITLQRANHIREYSIRQVAGQGWEVRVAEDATLTRQMRYRDWHRVERAIASMYRDVADLTAQGWEVATP